ncbi:acyltransferase [Niabella ginsengisoli]|uniref:N-acetyltransferase n=1 Tax=Niabella ginsengisoli TaxID=522298 RepID=A0ABS9SDU3_9BACT|nr:N-acetyltransferase [Niabella ginsengisoli]MCH5596529.1 N-acetyltransferase [Niabella ginsengisoli]
MADHYVHPTSIVDEGAEIGLDTKIWHFCHVMGTAVIGQACILGQNVFIGDKVVVGNKVKIQNNVSLYEGVICEDEVFIGPSAVFTNVINPRSAVDRKQEFKPTLIKKGATIGANATIVCGVEIGKYAFVGAGAVVTKDIPDYTLMVGNPAKQIGWVNEMGERISFNEFGKYSCPKTKKAYILKEGIVSVKNIG